MIRTYIFNTVPLNILTANEFINVILDLVVKKSKKKIFYLNAHTLTLAKENKKFLNVLKKSDLNYADGWGAVFIGRLLLGSKIPRVNAADFIDDLLKKLNTRKIRIFLLGDSDRVLEKAKTNIEDNFSNLLICGVYNGFFASGEENKIIRNIKNSNPNLVLVGMGSPKQELWITNNYSKLPSSTYWAVGGLFNYIAGVRKRAPRWIRRVRLEWLFRLLQEPQRLSKRYTFGNIKFIFYIVKFWVKQMLINMF